MAGPGNMIPDGISRTMQEKAPAKVQQTWPEDSLDGLPPTQYPDLRANPSLDTRTLMANVDAIARRHWHDKPGREFDPSGEGNGNGSVPPPYSRYPSVGPETEK